MIAGNCGAIAITATIRAHAMKRERYDTSIATWAGIAATCIGIGGRTRRPFFGSSVTSMQQIHSDVRNLPGQGYPGSIRIFMAEK